MNILADFHRRLHRWYAKYGRRGLPWRNTPDPYAIYVSEIMLQQTQVKTVLERYYFPFLARFPTFAALAAAPQDDVLQAWQGLGYYNRALNLQKAAKLCRGALPHTVEALQSLPGIGRNTACAVVAFAYRQPVAIMEANVKRVLCRIFALETASENELWAKAQALLDIAEPFDYNQAMMDIGAMICTKTAPDCPACPANRICKGQLAPERYPAPKAAKITPVRRKNIILFRNRNGNYYAAPRKSRFLNGLYHFIETEAAQPEVTFQTRTHRIQDATPLGSIRQQYSHFTLEAQVWLIDTPGRSNTSYYSLAELRRLPMSMAEQKILKLLLAIPAQGALFTRQ